MTVVENSLPWPFIWRRLHSLTGVFLVLFLVFHLITNSQAAFPIGEDGRDFIHEVNAIHHLPYLRVIEFFLLGVPILIHAIWGIHYLFGSHSNLFDQGGKAPYLPYGRNYAYTLQRISAWILLIGITGHVVQMRFLNGISQLDLNYDRYYIQKLHLDEGLETVADRLNVLLLTGEAVAKSHFEALMPVEENQSLAVNEQRRLRLERIFEVLSSYPLEGKGDRLAITRDFGTAMLLLLREIFQNFWMAIGYMLFVLFAIYHAFNGLWTATLTWGVCLNQTTQRRCLRLSQLLMGSIACLAILTIWGSYWINLRM